MITINEYVKVQNIGEAYRLLTIEPNAAIIGGGVFMKLGSRRIGKAIDLSGTGLDFIRETADTIEIGAMATFRQLETNPVLQDNLGGIIPQSARNIVGVQLRNMVTVGGTVFGRLGFSELLTALMALDTMVVLYRHGTMTLPDFLNKGNLQDILEKIIVVKQPLSGSYQMFRNSSGSLPVLAVAVTRSESKFRIAVGARPGLAAPAVQAMEILNHVSEVTPDIASQAGAAAAEELEFGNDRRASAVYRQELCRVLMKRAVMEVQS